MKDDYKGLDFGSYCTIEMFRHGADNEFYTHKVIGRLNSNAAIAVPIKYGIGGTGHEEIIGEEIVPCLKVVCQGIDETKVFKVRVSDVSPQIKSDFSGSYAPIP
jgi:hypothetical protein